MATILPTAYTRKSLFAPSPATTRGQAVHLGGDPKGVNFLYTNGRAVIIRNLANPEIAKEYTGHSFQTTVARYAPSGYYIASADVQGNIRIWDTTQAENILKIETKVFSGRINDLDWDFESKRIIAVGEGKSKFGHAFLFDSASSVGEISGHAKVINSVSIRPGRPLRAATGSDDMTVNFYHGVPFKFNKSSTNHSRFVQCVRYSPNGDFFVSSGSDGKIFLYDGKTGDDVAELSAADGAHTGGVFSVSWSPDSRQLMTSSADQSVKIWDVATKTVASTFVFSDTQHVDHQQVGSLWQGQYQISLSLSGDINYLDPKSGNKPVRVVKGHTKGITSLAIDENQTLYTGSYDGRICSWTDGKDGGHLVSGSGHTNQITALVAEKGRVISAGMDDSIRTILTATNAFDQKVVASDGIPKGLAAFGNLTIFATHKDELVTLVDGSAETRLKLGYSPTAVAISPNGTTTAIGGEDGLVHLYDIKGQTLVEKAKLESNKGIITAISYSPKGDLVAVADASRNVIVYETSTNTMKLNQWGFHTARVNCVSWSPDGLHAVSGSLDTNIEVWSVEKPMQHISIKNAHTDSVTGAVFIDNNTVASCGQDAQIKIWSLTHY
ncbi:WD40 repeat-like protein [Batrachochytrium dendrobatidis]|nr:WD40 repeat-like protein [Batrachochytrium dendrobatidis]KAK5672906.1 WD40 repeat-like protein [Batrachochytrium dendrobatidis]